MTTPPEPARTPDTTGALSRDAGALLDALTTHPRRTLTLPELQQAWADTFPARVGRPSQRDALAHALTELDDAGLITASKTQDRTARPPLPTRVTLPAAPSGPDPTATDLARTTVWRPELAWATTARLTLNQVRLLRAINMWLRDHAHERDTLPMRERSLQIFGHEKTLDALATTSVFAPGRLTLTTLRAIRVHPPLPSVRIGDGPVLLVVENDNTFHSIRTALTHLSSPIGHLAWGAGGAFEASVRSCPDLPGITRVAYFGDLDRDGLRIPRNAAHTADSETLTPITPAASLYRMLLATGITQPGQHPVPTNEANNLATWLAHTDLIDPTINLLTSGHRIPQEALTSDHLTHDPTWTTTL